MHDTVASMLRKGLEHLFLGSGVWGGEERNCNQVDGGSWEAMQTDTVATVGVCVPQKDPLEKQRLKLSLNAPRV